MNRIHRVYVEILADDHKKQALYRQHLLNGNILHFRALGNSMWPSIRSGDIVHVSSRYRLHLGAILLYQRDQNWIVHRLVRIEQISAGEKRLFLRGDALLKNDAPVELDQILGQVSAIERDARLIRLDSPINKIWTALFRSPIFPRALMPILLQNLALFRRMGLRVLGNHL